MNTFIREVNQTGNFEFGMKALALHLYYISGFTSQTEDVDIYGVGDSVTDPDGANKQTLTDSAGKFSATDVGKTITISGMSNPNNNGAFTITDYVSATQIKYVNATGGAETSAFNWVITVDDKSFFSTEKNGSNGEINLTGSDFNFKDATAGAFTGGDVGKWLLLCDNATSTGTGDSVSAPVAGEQTITDAAGLFVASDDDRFITITGMTNSRNNGTFPITYISATQIKYTNPTGGAETSAFTWKITSRISGIYKISAYVDANTVTLDFRSGATEYPTQRISPNDDIIWHVLADTYQVPDRDTQWFQLTTPHTYGWALEIKRNEASGYIGATARVAVDGSFAGSKILGPVYFGALSTDDLWFYASIAEDKIIFPFQNVTDSNWGGFIIANLDVLEPTEKANENKIALMGEPNSDYNQWGNNWTFGWNIGNDVNGGFTWNYYQQMACSACDISYRNSTESLRRQSGRGLNKRTNKYDLGKSLLIQDYTNDDGYYERLGSLPGFYVVTSGVGEKTAFDNVWTKDKFHVASGHAMDWPGYTLQH